MGRVRVLLVDDSEDMRLLCRLVLEADPSFEVAGEATNGEDAIMQVAANCPDVIVLDVMMPVMDGMTALPILRDLCPSVPILLLTAAATAELRHHAMALGACAVLTKERALDGLPRHLAELCPAADSLQRGLQAS